MKRLQIMIDEDLDEAVERIARAEGLSKAAVIRRVLRETLNPLPPAGSDPLFRLIGTVQAEPNSCSGYGGDFTHRRAPSARRICHAEPSQ